MNVELLSLFFPSGLLEYFDVSNYKVGPDYYEFELKEKNIPPEGYNASELESKGFYESGDITDFPLRGKRCTYKMKRRKWLVKTTGAVVTRDWNILAKGTRMTEDFASFLKELNRYHSY